MGRRDETFDRPQHRTLDEVELRAIRGHIVREARTGIVRGMLGLGTLAGIMVGAYLVDSLLRGGLIRSYGDTPAISLAIGAALIVVLLPLLHLFRLLALRDLDRAPVYRVAGPIDVRNGIHLRLRRNGRESGHRLELVHGFHAQVDPEFIWRMDFVRTQHGPDWFFVLEMEAQRAATAQERADLNKFLWRTGVYTDTHGD